MIPDRKNSTKSVPWKTRRDLLAARAALEAAKNAVDVRHRGQYYPSVSLNVNGFLYRESYSDVSKWNAILMPTCQSSPRDRLRRHVRTAWSHLRQAALSESLVLRERVTTWQIAYKNVQNSQQRIRELTDEVVPQMKPTRKRETLFGMARLTNLTR